MMRTLFVVLGFLNSIKKVMVFFTFYQYYHQAVVPMLGGVAAVSVFVLVLVLNHCRSKSATGVTNEQAVNSKFKVFFKFRQTLKNYVR